MEKFRFRVILRFLIKSSGILALGTTLLGVVFLNTTIPEKTIQHFLQFNLSKQTKQKVTFEKVSGNFFSEVSLSGLKITDPKSKAPLFEADQIKLSYSLLDIILSLGYVSNAVKEITIRNGNFYLERDRNGEWSFKDFQENKKSNKPTKLPEFIGKIKLEKFTLHYKDYRGWGIKPLDKPFYDTIHSLSGDIQFQNKKPAQITLQGVLTSTKSPVHLNGFLYPETAHYDLNFSIDKMSLDQWGPYTLPFDGFIIRKDYASLDGNIRSKPKGSPEHVPFWYDLHFNVKHSEFKMPFLENPITNISGKVSLFYGTLSPQLIQEFIPSLPKNKAAKLFKELSDKKIIKPDGQIVSSLPKSLDLDKEWQFIEPALKTLLAHPYSKTTFENVHGTLGELPAQVRGEIQMNYTPKINLVIENNHAQLEKVSTAFSGLADLPMEGKAHLTFKVLGFLHSPKLVGTVLTKKASVANIEADSISASYEIANSKITISMPKIMLFENVWQGNGTVDLKTSYLNLEFISKAFSFEKLPVKEPYFRGTTQVIVGISGKAPTLDIKLNGESKTLKVAGLPIHYLSTQFQLNNYETHAITGKLETAKKDRTITISGKIINNKTVEVTLETPHYPIYDTFNPAEDLDPGDLTFSGAIRYPLPQKNQKNELKESPSAIFNAALTNAQINGEAFSSIKANGQFQNNVLSIHSLDAKDDNEEIRITGTFDKKGPINADVAVKNMPATYSWIQKYIPQKYKPFNGLISLNTTLKRGGKYPNIKGNLTISNGTISEQNFKALDTDFEYKNDSIEISKMMIAQEISRIFLKGFISAERLNIDVLDGTQIDLDEFVPLTMPYGNFRGIIQGKAHIEGAPFSPKIEADFKTLNLHTTFQTFDRIEGHISYDAPFLRVSSLAIESNQNKYVLQGQWDIKALSQKINGETPPYMFKLNIEKGQIQTFLSILDTLYSEFKFHTTYEKIRPEKVPNPNITITAKDEESRILLYELGNPTTVMELFYQKSTQVNPIETYKAAGWVNAVKGDMAGEVSVIGNPKGLPIVNAHLEITDLENAKLTAKKLTLTVTPVNEQMDYLIECTQGKIGELPFTDLATSGRIDDDGMLWVTKLEIGSDSLPKTNILSGSFPLSALWDKTKRNRPINLHVSLEGNQAALFTLFLPGINDITNQGKIACDISGTVENPQLNSSEFTLKNTVIRFDSKHPLFNAPVIISSANLSIKDNVISIPSLPFAWEQPSLRTLRFKSESRANNTGVLSGTLGLNHFNLTDLSYLVLDFDLHLAPTRWLVVNPNFKGTVDLADTSFVGPFEIPLSEKRQISVLDRIKKKQESGPKLTSLVTLRDTLITLSKEPSTAPLPMIELAVRTVLNKNVEVNGSFIGKGLLAGISAHLEFDEKKTPMKIGGTLNHPFIYDTLSVNNGEISLFNRSFKLLNNQEQKRYQPPGETNQHANTITFFPYQTTTDGLIPILNLSAVTIIEKNQAVSTNFSFNQDPPYTHIVLTLEGAATSIKEFRFDVFDSTSPQTFAGSLVYKTTYYIPTSLSDNYASQRESDAQQVIEILVPEIFVENQSTSEELLTQFGENRVNMIVRQEVLRPIEKQIADRVGLYDLRIDYNLGGDIFRRADATRREVGINAIQRVFSDDLFLRIRTDIDLESDRQKTHDSIGVSEIELTYYLLKKKNMSINYANIKDPYVRSDYHPKLSLRYSHEF